MKASAWMYGVACWVGNAVRQVRALLFERPLRHVGDESDECRRVGRHAGRSRRRPPRSPARSWLPGTRAPPLLDECRVVGQGGAPGLGSDQLTGPLSGAPGDCESRATSYRSLRTRSIVSAVRRWAPRRRAALRSDPFRPQLVSGAPRRARVAAAVGAVARVGVRDDAEPRPGFFRCGAVVGHPHVVIGSDGGAVDRKKRATAS